jgi:MFS family permease
MAQRAEVAAVYSASVVQGVALVTFPAASAVLTSPQYYNLTSTQYGAMFLPQALTAILSALLGASMARSLGAKRIFALGLVANLISMLLLVLSQLTIGHGSLAYLMLLLATTSLGLGFGLTVPALNTLAASFFPERVELCSSSTRCWGWGLRSRPFSSRSSPGWASGGACRSVSPFCWRDCWRSACGCHCALAKERRRWLMARQR